MGWGSGVDPGGIGDGGVSVAPARCGAAEWGWFGRVGRAAKPGAGLRKYIRIETGCEASSGAERRGESCGCADCASLGGGCCGSAGAVVAGSRYWKHAPACGDCEFCAAVSSDWNSGAAKCEAGGDAAIRDVVQPAGRARFELARCANAPAKRVGDEPAGSDFLLFFPSFLGGYRAGVEAGSESDVCANSGNGFQRQPRPSAAGFFSMQAAGDDGGIFRVAGEQRDYFCADQRWAAGVCSDWEFLSGADGPRDDWGDDLVHFRGAAYRSGRAERVNQLQFAGKYAGGAVGLFLGDWGDFAVSFC